MAVINRVLERAAEIRRLRWLNKLNKKREKKGLPQRDDLTLTEAKELET